jgi:hypothetical protein
LRAALEPGRGFGSPAGDAVDLRARAPLAALAVLVAVLIGVLIAPRSRPGLAAPPPPAAAALFAPPALLGLAGAPAPVSAIAPGAPAIERADKHLVRWYRAPLAGGLLVFPPSFASEDGQYDLILHLNGNTDLVEESYGYAGVNAVVVILNLGVGSGVYEDRFADPAAFALILSRAQSVLRERGLVNPRLRRVAVSGWSSGYGGVLKLLQNDAIFDRIDAVVLFDAIHCGYDPDTHKLKPDQIEPIRRFARKAVEGKALLTITHSDIETYGYLNARKTADVVLDTVGVRRARATEPQPMPELHSMVGVLPRALMVSLTPRDEAHEGELHVRGYTGNGPVTHMLHLVQMSTTALPDLVRYWKR